ncbi:hypothetical protein [Treponema pectinovorum]|uniref:hypothetical protein n=1 Tax=Treponema pectinovorum TaxID=164 RepID=UPI0011CAEE9A|nr:hypothetical protein [Treponema pectinovorum]
MNVAFFTSVLALITSIVTIGGYFYKAGRLRERMETIEKELSTQKKCIADIEQETKGDVKDIKRALDTLTIEFTRSFTEFKTSLNFIKSQLGRQ